MASLAEKTKTGLDECRMLVLVVQVLIGFHFRGIFEPGYDRLPPSSQYLLLGAFGLLLIALAVLLTAPSYHRIVERGEDGPDFTRMLAGMTWVALLPFALAVALDFAIPSRKLFGGLAGTFLGAAAGTVALFFWYGIEMLAKNPKGESSMGDNEGGKTKLADKISQVLTEGRIVLPGAQALLGFQLIAFLTDAFEKLPRSSQLIHMAALSLVGLSAILLMTPPAYHRIVEKGEETQRFLRVANLFVVSAMIPLALGICLDFYVVLNKVTQTPALSMGLAAVILSLFYGLWFVFPWVRARSIRLS